jgi:HAD superfamily hydrolase (TIGR01509 family)
MAYRGVIFDIDGTLVDSNDAHARAWQRALSDHGLQHPLEAIRPLIGMGGDQLLKQLEGMTKEDLRYEPISEAWKRHFNDEEVQGVQGQPGARDLVVALGKRGLRLIVGTSADEALVDALLDKVGLKNVLRERTTASEVEASKPEPDIVQAAVKKLGLEPREVVMVGDTPFDVEAARRAGVDTIFLRCGGDERSEGAIAVYNSPQDLLEHLDESPLARG